MVAPARQHAADTRRRGQASPLSFTNAGDPGEQESELGGAEGISEMSQLWPTMGAIPRLETK